jgi:hypothetical protein
VQSNARREALRRNGNVVTTYLYGFLSASTDLSVPQGLLGIGDTPVRAIAVGPDIEAWVGTADPAPLKQLPAVTAQNALAHHAVLDAALTTGRTPLPARFGQRFPSDAACLSKVVARASVIRAALTRVDGLVEMSILLAPSTRRVLRELQPITPHSIRSNESQAGRRYLDALRANARKGERRDAFASAVVEQLSTALAPYVRAERRQARGQASGIVVASLAHLVSRGDAEEYRLAAHQVESPSGFQLVVAGPRPPYSFCDQGDDAPGMNLAG